MWAEIWNRESSLNSCPCIEQSRMDANEPAFQTAAKQAGSGNPCSFCQRMFHVPTDFIRITSRPFAITTDFHSRRFAFIRG